jgi:hypothetical protein
LAAKAKESGVGKACSTVSIGLKNGACGVWMAISVLMLSMVTFFIILWLDCPSECLFCSSVLPFCLHSSILAALLPHLIHIYSGGDTISHPLIGEDNVKYRGGKLMAGATFFSLAQRNGDV